MNRNPDLRTSPARSAAGCPCCCCSSSICIVLLIVGVIIYTKVTPFRERELLRKAMSRRQLCSAVR